MKYQIKVECGQKTDITFNPDLDGEAKKAEYYPQIITEMGMCALTFGKTMEKEIGVIFIDLLLKHSLIIRMACHK